MMQMPNQGYNKNACVPLSIPKSQCLLSQYVRAKSETSR